MANNKNYVLWAAILVLYAATGYLYFKTSQLQKQDALNADLSKQIEQNGKVYTYNIDEIFYAMNIIEVKKRYEEDVIKLNNELLEAEEKIKSLKDAKVKEDFSQMYLKNLKLRRDELVSNYEKAVAELSEKLNKALDEIVKEKNVPAVFVQSAIAIKTPNTVDLTQEIIAKMKR